jgi:hypothetical protein
MCFIRRHTLANLTGPQKDSFKILLLFSDYKGKIILKNIQSNEITKGKQKPP